MNARMRRTVLASMTAALTLLALPAGAPAGAEGADTPYFTKTTGPDLNQDSQASPIVGHFTQEGLDDILWYQHGPAKETMWTPCPDCSKPFTRKQLAASQQVTGYYDPIVADFGGDGLDDIYWHNNDPSPDYLWINKGDGTFTSTRRDGPPEEANAVVLRDSRTSTGKDDILWTTYPGQRIRLWVFPDDGSGIARTKAWLTQPKGEALVGDYDGNGAADILWYPHVTSCRCPVESAASAIDTLWRRGSSAAPSFTASTMNIKGEYDPVVGYFSGQGDARADILWVGQYSLCCTAPEDRPDSLWEGRANGGFLASNQSFPSSGGGTLIPHGGADTVLVRDYDPMTNTSAMTMWFDTGSGSVLRPLGDELPNLLNPVIGHFVDPSRADIYDYVPGAGADALYHPIF